MIVLVAKIRRAANGEPSPCMQAAHLCLTRHLLHVVSEHLTGGMLLCRPEWKEYAQRRREGMDAYHKRIRATFTFRMHDVPERLRLPDVYKEDSTPPAKRGVHLRSGLSEPAVR